MCIACVVMVVVVSLYVCICYRVDALLFIGQFFWSFRYRYAAHTSGADVNIKDNVSTIT